MARLPDYADALKHLCRVDRRLGRLILRVGSCRLAPHTRRSPFQALVRAVVFQQLNGTVAEIIFNRFKGLYPSNGFPQPEQVLETPDDQLRSAGLSRAKTAAIRDIAAKTMSGLVPGSKDIRKMSDQEIVERLTQVRGVGPWTVEMLLIFTLGRPDVLPLNDYGVRKGFALTYGWNELPRPMELRDAGEKWRPFRSVASWYFWRALELPLPGAGPRQLRQVLP